MKRDLSQLLRSRTCYVCRQPIPERDAVYWPCFRLLAHRGECDELVSMSTKDYTRSRRGRLQNRRAVLDLVDRLAHLARQTATMIP